MLQTIISKNNKYFIININSSSVSGALVYFDREKEKPVIEYSHKSFFELKEELSAEDFRNNTKKALNLVLDNLTNYLNISGGIFNIKEAIVFLSAPWNRKSINTIIDERIEPFRVDEKSLEEFIADGGDMREDEELISAEIFSVKANGYDVLLSDLINKEVSKVEISLMDTYIKKNDKKFILESIKENFTFLNITFASFLPAFLNQIKEVYDIRDDFAFIDFTGEVMDFGLFQDEQIKGLIAVEAGQNKLIREIYKRGVAKNIVEASYLLKLYLAGDLEPKVREKIRILISDFSLDISEKIEDDLEKYDLDRVPHKAFVLSAGPINYLLEELDIFKKVYFIGKSFLSNFTETEDDKYWDNFLALEAFYLFNQ